MNDRRSTHVSKCNCFALRKAARAVSHLYDERLESTGLRITQFLCLMAIRDLSGITVHELADELDLDRTTMGKNLLPLERDGLVRVGRAEKDARVKLIHLTAAGRQKLDEALPLWRAAQSEMEDIMQGSLPNLRSALQLIKA